MLLLSDPAVAQLPVEDCGEDLIDVREVPELLVDATRGDSAGACFTAASSEGLNGAARR